MHNWGKLQHYFSIGIQLSYFLGKTLQGSAEVQYCIVCIYFEIFVGSMAIANLSHINTGRILDLAYILNFDEYLLYSHWLQARVAAYDEHPSMNFGSIQTPFTSRTSPEGQDSVLAEARPTEARTKSKSFIQI